MRVIAKSLLSVFASNASRSIHYLLWGALALTVLTLGGCGSDDTPPADQATDVPASAPVSGGRETVVQPITVDPADRQTLAVPIESEKMTDTQADNDVSPETMPTEPRADEIARTLELESELSELVQIAGGMLDPQKAQELMTRADSWAQDDFGCPQGAGREACRQLNIRNLIKEIDNQMRGVNTEY